MRVLDDLYADAPSPKNSWKDLAQEARVAVVNKILLDGNSSDLLTIESCEEDGSVFVSFKSSLAANARGTVLLDFEQALKEQIDYGLTVWHIPQGDKSSLRRLRGVEVKTI